MARRHGLPTLRTAKGGSIMKALLERPLGTSDLQITQVGFGAWAIGGGGWDYGRGRQDDAESLAALPPAADSRIKLRDTPATSRLGPSVGVVGGELRENPAGQVPHPLHKDG